MEMNGVIMRTHVVVLCSVVGFIGLVVVILGVAGEAATAQALAGFNGDGKCVYRTTPALGCGLVAALLALTAQVVVTATSLCCGCCRTWEVPTETRRIVGIALSAVSWIIVILVVALFIAGAAINTDHERWPTSADDAACPVDPSGALFAAATVFSLVATGLQVASYVLLLATPKAGSTKPLAAQQPEVAMGQPAQQDAEEVVAGGGDPPTASVAPPPSSQATEPTSQV